MKLLKITSLFIALVLTSCGPRVQTEKTTTKDLSVYETFAYLPNANVEAAADASVSDNPALNQAIVEAINTNLRQEGYQLNRDNPDLLVLVQTETDPETTTTVNSRYVTYPYTTSVGTVYPTYDPYYYRGYYNWYRGYNYPFRGYDIDTYTYEQGTVVIYLVDRETNNTVWKGVASESIYSQSTPAAVQEMINAIFEAFPK